MTDPRLITVYVAASLAEAQILGGLLISEGIAARVAGADLNDEFGMAQKMGPVEVGVPPSRVDEAKDIVAAWRASGTESGGDPKPA